MSAVARRHLSASLHQDNGRLQNHGVVPEVQVAFVLAPHRRPLQRRRTLPRLWKVSALARATGSAAWIRRDFETRSSQVWIEIWPRLWCCSWCTILCHDIVLVGFADGAHTCYSTPFQLTNLTDSSTKFSRLTRYKDEDASGASKTDGMATTCQRLLFNL